MDKISSDISTIRLLECWLPLAQALNQEQQWGYDSTTLERVIHAAATSLSYAHSVLAARVVLLVVGREYVQR